MDPPPAPLPLGAARAVLARPWLWAAALVTLFRLAPRGWWRRWPPVPRPDPAYMRFRLTTQYGDPQHPAEAHDLLTYLRWQRGWTRARSIVS